MDSNKKQIKFAGGALALAAFIVGAFSISPASTTAPIDDNQVVVTGEVKLKQKLKFCAEQCPALITIGDYEVFVEYGLDGESIRYMEPMSVSKDGIEVNAYIDQVDIQNINAAILRGEL
ncbi:hypothetical protein D9K80_17360 [Acinetobacter cumulans]|uniref:Uncharacterized protein n=1 Tax=Acinetobacter cumulans TaxID=2136182 RepID=A0A498CSI8_9GAMM|nr:hypothetical protein [Acinetobacter cumulans]RLL29055.1 hypothetical protein D9K80_17360 [Acinetobacter cumulans]